MKLPLILLHLIYIILFYHYCSVLPRIFFCSGARERGGKRCSSSSVRGEGGAARSLLLAGGGQ